MRVRASRRAIRAALEAAVDFLVTAQEGDGLWRDFPSFVGESDEWVTGYVCNALLDISFPIPASSVRNAWRAMKRRQRRTGGWGYNEDSPPDADSTAWAYRTLAKLGESDSKSASRAKAFLLEHQRSDGGIATYASPMPLRRKFARPSSLKSYLGWCVTDPCVTAAVVDALDAKHQRRAVAFLRKRQRFHGEWDGYWWADYEYATTLALDAVTRFGQNDREVPIERALTWMSHRMQPSGAVVSKTTGRPSPFATACALRALAQRPKKNLDETVVKCVAWLIQNQESDGAWQSSATLRIPLPSDRTPDSFDNWKFGGGIGDICLDQRAVFTTASVVAGLNRCL